MKKRINKFVTISDDGITVYEKFRWLVEWVTYCEILHDESERLAFNDAIAEYGIMSKEPTGITGATLEYFNMEIKPELDRQHEQMMKGRDIRNKQNKQNKQARIRLFFVRHFTSNCVL